LSASAARRASRFACLSLLAATVCAAADGADGRLSSATTRCTERAELIACGEALSIKPDDPDLLIAEGDALVRRKRAGEAIGVYRNALKHGAPSATVSPRITAAAALRRSLLSLCLQGGLDAERACDAAWLPGASDEVAVFKRRGQLLREAGRSGAALEAYLAAARLRPLDRSVAQAVIALSAGDARLDAQNLVTVGTAFMTLGRRAQAIAAFRQALRLRPDLPGVKERLRLAEHPANRGADGAASLVAGAPASASPATASGDARLYTNEAESTRSN
jgi:tetratricopeptide (TPR) repeat protein